jgi:hypothetical protein
MTDIERLARELAKSNIQDIMFVGPYYSDWGQLKPWAKEFFITQAQGLAIFCQDELGWRKVDEDQKMPLPDIRPSTVCPDCLVEMTELSGGTYECPKCKHWFSKYSASESTELAISGLQNHRIYGAGFRKVSKLVEE